MSDNFILAPLKRWVDSKLPIDGVLRWLYKPVFGCVVCMASVWGTLAYLIIRQGLISVDYPLIIVCAAFMNLFVYSLLERVER